MNKRHKYLNYMLLVAVISLCGQISSYLTNESVMICDIHVMLYIILFHQKWIESMDKEDK